MIIQADAFHLPYASGIFHSIVTSPPYWGLRKYAGEQGEEPLGLEPTPERYIERLVEVFREVHKVLRPDGVVWLNLGDCFSAAGWESSRRSLVGQGSFDPAERKSGKIPGAKGGFLMMMPHRVAIALQDDGWIVRNDLVWFKRNPMPESVSGWTWQRHRRKIKKGNTSILLQEREKNKASWTVVSGQGTQRRELSNPIWGDCPGCEKCNPNNGYILKKGSFRHTRAHEYIFMLTKKMNYYCNQEAVRESSDSGEEHLAGSHAVQGSIVQSDNNRTGKSTRRFSPQGGRNPRSVLDVPTAPYKSGHYATFPPRLIAPLIRASVPRRCCPECGQAWAPVVDKGEVTGVPGEGGEGYRLEKAQLAEGTNIKGRSEGWTPNHFIPSSVTDYRPTCECGLDDHEPGIVLDIFGGSGTTGMVAKQLMRRWVVMDVSHPYLDEQAKVRTKSGSPSTALDGLPMFDLDTD